MSPEAFVADVITKAFPGSSVKIWRDEPRQAFVFKFQIDAERTWTLEQTFWEEDVHAKPHAVARELATKIRHHMESEMSDIRISMTTGANASSNAGYTYQAGMTNSGWYDTDQRRRDEARLLAIMKADKEKKDEDDAKKSILDSLARKTRKQVEQGR